MGPTNLVQLNLEVFSILVVEQRLGRTAVGAVGFAEDNDAVLIDDGLGFGLCGRHGGGTCCRKAAREEVLEWVEYESHGGQRIDVI